MLARVEDVMRTTLLDQSWSEVYDGAWMYDNVSSTVADDQLRKVSRTPKHECQNTLSNYQ